MSSMIAGGISDRVFPGVFRAGAAIMQHFADDIVVAGKSDGSPVTRADRDAEDAILATLAQNFPAIPVISEESRATASCGDGTAFFLVDPLDGTREFIARRPEFTVNVALIEDGVPVFGMIYAPAASRLYWTDSQEAYACTIDAVSDSLALSVYAARRLRCAPQSGAQRIVASRSHGSAELETWLKDIEVGARLDIGSSLKFCLLAEGAADLYPRFGPTREWDTAAGHAILLAAGGCVRGVDGAPFVYGKQAAGYLNPGFVAAASASALARLCLTSPAAP